MSNEPGFLETLKGQDMIPELNIPVDPTHPLYGEASGHLSYQASQEERAKENVPLTDGRIREMLARDKAEQEGYYRDSIIMFAIEATNKIPGIEFESYEDWEAHVDKIVAKIEAYRVLTSE
jgi:hypothetical protein